MTRLTITYFGTQSRLERRGQRSLGKCSLTGHSNLKILADSDSITNLQVRTISVMEFFSISDEERRAYDITRNDPLTSGGVRANQSLPFTNRGKTFEPTSGSCWKTTVRTRDGSTPGMQRLAWADRIGVGRSTFYYKRKFDDFAYKPISNLWTGFGGASEPIRCMSFKRMSV